jgi:hypothetical protein
MKECLCIVCQRPFQACETWKTVTTENQLESNITLTLTKENTNLCCKVQKNQPIQCGC